MGLKDEVGETGLGGGVIWARGPALAYTSPLEESITEAHTACTAGDADALAAALDKEAALLDKPKLDGTTPLMIAARVSSDDDNIDGRMACAKLLLSKGCEVDARDMHGDTALTLAAMSEKEGSTASTGMCKMLIDAGADLTIQEKNFQMTALHWAALGGKPAVVKELLKSKDAAKAKAIKDKEGKTAKEYAKDSKHNADAVAGLL